MEKSEKSIVFVYGTLKQGHHNHGLLKGSKFLGTAKTLNKYPLVASGLPYLFHAPGSGYNVKGEVYEVDQETFYMLDRLEGHPAFYYRKKVGVTLKNVVVQAYIYFINEPLPKNIESSYLEEY